MDIFRLAVDVESEQINNLPDIFIGRLPEYVQKGNVVDLFEIKYGVSPASVQVKRGEAVMKDECFSLVKLREWDAQKVDHIVQDIRAGYYQQGSTAYYPMLLEIPLLNESTTGVKASPEQVENLDGDETSTRDRLLRPLPTFFD